MACSVVRTFMGTIQFVSMGAFFTNIADPTIGGTYMTLLNTISNLGGIYPQYFILKFVDYFGYYNVAMSLATLGIVLGMFVIRPRVSHLQSVPISFWRIG
jgi:MFS transporter, PAT family, solute carrier family 33 (acetyl-CoA transportor), member 1